MRKVKEQLERLDDNTKMPPEIKKQQYDRKKEELSAANTKYSSLKAKIDDLQTQHDTATDYLETNDFFRHLRNSVSHGFYSIDFSEGLKRKNLGKIVFHFEDWEIDQNDRTKRRQVFGADITADKLTSIFEELNERLINSADSFRQQEDIRYAIIDKRDPQNRDPEYQKRLENSLTKRGGIIIRP